MAWRRVVELGVDGDRGTTPPHLGRPTENGEHARRGFRKIFDGPWYL
jgi:hypothetical protein